jgi:broad specificity phosphatase PhoE
MELDSSLSSGLLISRHGETTDNEMGVLSGHRQVGLSPRGYAQARRLEVLLRGTRIDTIYTSDLRRSLETGIIVSRNAIKVCSTPLLRERDGGSITGRLRHEVDWDKLPADVESCSEMMDRAYRFLRQLAPGNILIIGHEGINKALIAVLIGCSMREASYQTCVKEHCGLSYFPVRIYESSREAV